MNNRRLDVTATNAERAIFNAIRNAYGPDAIATAGYLRSEVLMPTTGITSIKFPITAQDNSGGAQRTSEKRLLNNDAFLATHLGVFIARQDTTLAQSSEILHSFPNPRIFTNAADGLTGVQGFYAGSLQVRVNETVYFDALDCLSFMRADTAQQGNANSAVAVTGVVGWSAWEADRCFKRITPNIAFNGLGNNFVQVNLPESLVLGTATAGQANIAVFIARGFNIQNGAKSAN